jgi:hypothetical protein
MPEDASRRPVDAPDPDDAAAPVDGAEGLWEFGLAASRVMAERVQQLYRDLPSGEVPGAADTELRQLRVDLERAADVSLDLFDRVLALVRRIDPATPAEPTPSDELVVRARAGERAGEGLWVHNLSDASQPPPELRCSEVASFEGVCLPPECLRIECAAQSIDGRNSRFVELVVDLPATTPRGIYHGLLLARDPQLTLRVRVEVT